MKTACPRARQAMRAAPVDQIYVAVRDTLDATGVRSRLWLSDYREVTLRTVDEREPAEARVVDSGIGRVFANQRPTVVLRGDTLTSYLPVSIRGERLGVLQVSAHQGRLADGDLDHLAQLATDLAAEVLVAGHMTDHFEFCRRVKPLTVAAEMQWALLPATSHEDPRFALAGVLEPAYSVAGDAFDWAIKGDIVTVAVCDGAKRGVPTSLSTALCLSALRNARRAPVSLADQAALADQALYAYYGGDNYVSTLLLELDVVRGKAVVIDAGSPRLLRLRDGAIEQLELEAQLPLGMFEETRYTEQIIDIAPGDRLVIVSDGVYSVGQPSEFGGPALHSVLEKSAAQSAQEMLRNMMVALHTHQSDELEDDAVAVCLDWHAAPAAVLHE